MAEDANMADGTGAEAPMVVEGSSSGLEYFLHPLVLINISDHAMRAKQLAQQTRFPRVIGCLMGQHQGRNVDISNSFEMVEAASSSGEATFDHETYTQKLEQYQEVFKSLEVIGWYATGAGLQAADLQVHKKLAEQCEGPIFLSMDPQAATQVGAKDLPLSLYESGVHLVDDQPHMRFVKVTHSISSSDAERIGVNSAAEVTTGAVGANSALARHYTGLHGSLAMLAERLEHLVPLLQKMQAGDVPVNHQVLRMVSGLLSRFPGSSVQDVQRALASECTDTTIVNMLCLMTRGISQGQGAQVARPAIHDPLIPWLQNMPPLPAHYSPDGERWTNSVAVCAIMRDENITDVREFLQYYRWLGVDHVFLTDNDSKAAGTSLPQLAREFSPDFLTLRQEMLPKSQLKAYAWCAEEQRRSYNWIAFLDLDEFLVLRAASGKADPPDLKGFLDNYKHHAGLSVSWIMVGPGQKGRRVPRGGVLAHYKQCVPRPNQHFKTIANMFYISGLSIHSHNFVFRDKMFSVDESFNELPYQWKPYPKRHDVGLQRWTSQDCKEAGQGAHRDYQVWRHCYLTAAPVTQNATADKIALFHYATKSLQDFNLKMQRGSGMSYTAKKHEYFQRIKAAQRNATICKEPSQLADRCCDLSAGQSHTAQRNEHPDAAQAHSSLRSYTLAVSLITGETLQHRGLEHDAHLHRSMDGSTAIYLGAATGMGVLVLWSVVRRSLWRRKHTRK